MCGRTQMPEHSGDWTAQELADEATRRGKATSRETVRRLCANGKIRGAKKPATDWLIPDYAARVWLDERVRSK